METKFTSYKVEKRATVTAFSDGQYGSLETSVQLVDRIRTRNEAERLAEELDGYVVTLEWGFVPNWA